MYICVYAGRGVDSSQFGWVFLLSLTEALLMMTFSFWSLGLAAKHTHKTGKREKEIPKKRLVSLAGFSFSSIFFRISVWT